MFKRFVTLLLALVMCAALIPAMLVSAAETAPAQQTLFKLDFADMTALPTQKDAYGFKAFNGYAASTASDGVAHILNQPEGGQAFVDLQFWTCDLTAIAESFTLSMQIKPVGTWNRADRDFFNFRKDTNANMHTYFYTSEGKIGIKADDGDKLSEALPTDAFTKVDWKWVMTDGVFTSVELYVNDAKIGTKTMTDADLTSIAHLRFFTTYTGNVGMDIDSIECLVAKKAAEVVPNVPTLPTVAEEDRVYMDWILHQDFSGSANIGPNPTNAVKEDGFWFKMDDENCYKIEDGAFVYKHTSDVFLDLQLFNTADYNVKEDFVLSFNFKPLKTVSTTHVVDFRYDGNADWIVEKLKFSKNKVIVDGVECGVLPTNEWTLIELAFHYNTSTKMFDKFDLMLNGTVVGSAEIPADALMMKVQHFRMLRYLQDDSFMLDDVNVVLGNKSLVYAMPYGSVEPEPPVDNTTTEAPETPDTPTGETLTTATPTTATPSTQAPSTQAPSTQAPAVTAGENKNEEKKGCKAVASGSLIVLLACITAAGVQIAKKKD